MAAALALSALFAVGAPTASAGTALKGKFTIAEGSWFRMQLPGGSGFLENANSTATDKTFTPIKGGSDGGILSGKYQGAASGEFDGSGNSLASKIITPTAFFGLNFGVKTVRGRTTPAPLFSISGGSVKVLKASLKGFTVGWNKQTFNQGQPKPGKSKPLAIGTYNPTTKAYTLDWTSPIVGGPFNGFSGVWHLEGKFTASR